MKKVKIVEVGEKDIEIDGKKVEETRIDLILKNLIEEGYKLMFVKKEVYHER